MESVNVSTKTLNSMLAKVIAENQHDWDTKLPAMMAAYRAARHSVRLGFRPTCLYWGERTELLLTLHWVQFLKAQRVRTIGPMTSMCMISYVYTRRLIAWHESILELWLRDAKWSMICA